MAIGVRSAASLVAVAGLAVGTIRADNFIFSNDCGSGTWGGVCTSGGGIYSSNWGRTGPNSPALLPGSSDTCLLAGAVTLDIDAAVSSLTVPAGASLAWPYGSVNVGSMSNSGTVTASQGFNKFFSGTMVNGPAGLFSLTAGSTYLNLGNDAGSLITNQGVIDIGAAALRRNGGASAVIASSGLVRASQPGGGIADLTLVSNNGTWSTLAGASLEMSSVALSGTFVGDHDGAATLTGSVTLAGNATLNTVAGSNPWGWSTGSVDTGAFTLTNAGWMRLDQGFNKFFSGTMVNGPAALLSLTGGNTYVNPGNSASSLITNQGVIDIGAAGLRRNGGVSAALASSGLVRASQPGGGISDLTLVSSNGTWSALAGASLDMSGVALSGTFVGDHAGAWTMSGVVTLSGDAVFTTSLTSVNPWQWTSATMDTGAFTFTNNGRLEMNTGFNKFLTGTAVNGGTGNWAFTQGNTYVSSGSGTTTLTNNGAMTFTGNTAIARNGGAIASARFVNGGTVTAITTGTGGSVQNVSVTSNSGTWRTEPGATFALSDDLLAGTFVGDHAGDGLLMGTMALSANAAFTTTGGSVNPWRWTSAVIDANGFILTNNGRMEMTSGFNKFAAGTVVNAPGATWACTQGNFYLSPGGVTGVATLANNGTLTMENNTSIARNGGSAATAVLTNNGLLHVLGGSSDYSSIGVVNGPAGVIRIDSGASLQLPDGWAMTGGRLEGTGQLASYGPGIVNSGGVMAPGLGAAAGTMTMPTHYTQTADGTLEIAVVSNGVTQTADKLAFNSGGFNATAVLGGTLRVVLPNGTTPPPIGGQDLLIVNAPGGRVGTFSAVTEANPIPGYRYMVIYTETQVYLRVIHRCGGADVGAAGGDANFDGTLDNNDFIAFITLFFAHDPSADVGIAGGLFGSDGLFDNNDFISFINLFFSGCH